jgi:hypothetical protein
MNNNMVRAFVSAFLMVSSSALCAELSQAEIMQHRQQSVQDWQTILSVLSKAGYTDKDSVYKRTNRALHRSQTLLAHAQKGGFAGKRRIASKETHMKSKKGTEHKKASENKKKHTGSKKKKKTKKS